MQDFLSGKTTWPAKQRKYLDFKIRMKIRSLSEPKRGRFCLFGVEIWFLLSKTKTDQSFPVLLHMLHRRDLDIETRDMRRIMRKPTF